MRAVLSCMRALENRGSPSSRRSRVRQSAPLAWWLDLFAAPASSTQGERAPQPAYSPLVLALRECCRGGVSSGCAAGRGGRAILFPRKHFCALRTFIYPYKAEVVSLVGLSAIGRVFNTTYRDACTIGKCISLNFAQYLFCATKRQGRQGFGFPVPYLKNAFPVCVYFILYIINTAYSYIERPAKFADQSGIYGRPRTAILAGQGWPSVPTFAACLFARRASRAYNSSSSRGPVA